MGDQAPRRPRHLRRILLGGALALACIATIGFVVLPSDEARGGMSSSAITGTLETTAPLQEVRVGFKVVDSLTGDIVWQSIPTEVAATVGGGVITYSAQVNEDFRPDDPRYEWVMWVYAVRAKTEVRVADFVFKDVFDVDHHAVVPEGNIQGRIVEVAVNIDQ